MGFIICDDQKQNLNLSSYAWTIIYDDMANFYEDEENKTNLSGFLNTVFRNYYLVANASISIKVDKFNEEVNNLLNEHFYKKITEGLLSDLHKKIVSSYIKKLKFEQKKFPKGEYKKFRINNENYKYLTDIECTEDIYYDSTLGLYLKNLFEEYSRHTYSEREKIFFQDKINIINKSIIDKSIIKVTIKNDKQFEISPYSVEVDKVGTFNYLTGFEINGNICSFRISRIKNIKQYNSKKTKITQEMKAHLDYELTLHGPQFLSGDNKEIIIQLTDKGIEKYNKQILMRPNVVEINDKYFYKFFCSDMQIIVYFFKFGRDVKIISPESLRDNFIKYYLQALKNYGYTVDDQKIIRKIL